MDQIKTLLINVIETQGQLTASISQGMSNADGEECTRQKIINLPVIEPACCQECWIDQLLAELSDVSGAFAWKYFHSEACTADHKEATDA